MFYIGIDDSGRGPVIGPMVLAGVLADKKQIEKLKRLDVKDSKLITPKRRTFLAKEIRKIAMGFEIVQASPEEIDEKIAQKVNLNKIEALKTAEIINNLSKKIKKADVIVDCPSPNTHSWHNYLMKHILNLEKINLSCEHKADLNHTIVGAASILAKVTRDTEVEKLREHYDIQCGSGYPADPLCQEFLKTEKAKELAKLGLIRKSWSTWKREEKRRGQRKLKDF